MFFKVLPKFPKHYFKVFLKFFFCVLPESEHKREILALGEKLVGKKPEAENNDTEFKRKINNYKKSLIIFKTFLSKFSKTPPLTKFFGNLVNGSTLVYCT